MLMNSTSFAIQVRLISYFSTWNCRSVLWFGEIEISDCYCDCFAFDFFVLFCIKVE